MLDDIGFYTLSDERARTASATSIMQRCEILVTGKCNFNCPYCRGIRYGHGYLTEHVPLQTILKPIRVWTYEGVKNIRFSGGEPTLYPDLVHLATVAKVYGVERVAISTNGSASQDAYAKLIDAGVDDFSVSLDACCAMDAVAMNGSTDFTFDKLCENIRFLAERVYTTVGVVVTADTISALPKTIALADSLGVADIRIISAAQYDQLLVAALEVPDKMLEDNPILRYRVNNIKQGRNVRGLQKGDSHKCHLALDDSVVVGDYHFPCVIYMREGGRPIGTVHENMRGERVVWRAKHDTHTDPICKGNCLDVCIDYNNCVDLIGGGK